VVDAPQQTTALIDQFLASLTPMPRREASLHVEVRIPTL